MGTAEFAVPPLEALLAQGYPVAGVYTQADKPAGRGLKLEQSAVRRCALQHGLAVLEPTTLRDSAVQEQLAALRPRVIVVAAYGKLLPPQVLALPPSGCVNIHPSLLPKYRGPSPVTAALLNGDTFTGVTIMLLDEGMDTGPLLAQERVAIALQDTTETLTHQLAQVGARLLMETLPRWVKGEVHPQPQDHTQASVTQKVEKRDAELDWSVPAPELERRIRAYSPWPGAYTRWHGRLLKVLESESCRGGEEQPPGKVVALSEHGAVGVVTGSGVLLLSRVQLEGRSALSCQEFLRGARDFVGSLLAS